MPAALAFMTSPDFITGLLSLLFTIMILSYVVGDNNAFRLAIHVFIGVAAGYVAAIVLLQVIANKLLLPLAPLAGMLIQAITNKSPSPAAPGLGGETVLVIIPALVMGVFLLMKTSPRLEWLGRPVVAFLVGTGAAAAAAGAVRGTIYPQVMGSVNVVGIGVEGLTSGLIILLGTVVTLIYFQFTLLGSKTPTGRRGWIMAAIAWVGQVFIAVTLGTLFAGVFSAALTALVDRIQSIVIFVDGFISNLIRLFLS